LPGKTAKLYKGMPRRLKKTMTPKKLPTYVCSYSGRKSLINHFFFRRLEVLLLFYVQYRRERERERERRKEKNKNENYYYINYYVSR